MPFLGPPIVITPIPPAPPAAQKLILTLERDGQSLDLPLSADVEDHVWCVAPGIEGLDIPASSLIQKRTAGMFGSFGAGIDVQAREVFLPLMVRASNMSDWFAKRDVFNKLTSPYEDLTVRITAHRADGTVRWIDGFRTGNTPVWDLGTWIPRIMWQKFGATFVCPDPWWRGLDTVLEWKHSGVPPIFFPITPVRLSPSRLFGDDNQILISGDVRVFPRWEIDGPATSVTATHIETGNSWTLSATLLAGQTAIVDTDPRAGLATPRVQGPSGQSWWSNIEQPYNLWSVPPGSQTITIEVDGLDVGTAVRMSLPSLWEMV